MTIPDPREDIILHISDTRHCFLEGWIRDHPVDFLMDSGIIGPRLLPYYKILPQTSNKWSPNRKISVYNQDFKGAGDVIRTLISECNVLFIGLNVNELITPI